MNRSTIFIAIVLAVIGIGGIVVWQIVMSSDPTSHVSTSAPAPQKFDTTGGQEMRPRWKTGEGEGDEAEN
ncbi:hypothetical protein OEG84_24360 [Hoeflea sp. G2-23]|uniref:Entry exclusion protein TrbK n=1 Tax=Hoeflea algicola TaxID=2983763 RepID=A0ABT3ZGD0_9HYPH|nr:hypothetical protein [Hoeflea algicola]MCY0150743.1 hypothetical protein [Hoeflea algicola]